MKDIKETKDKIIDALEGLKEFDLCYSEEVTHSKRFKARSKEELEKQFNNGELELDDRDIVNGEMIEGSLEIYEL